MSLPRFCASSLALLTLASLPELAHAQARPSSAPSAPAVGAPAATPPVADPVRVSDTVELARVVGLYEAGKYGDCADSLSRLLSADSPRPLRDPDVVESARIYHAACLIGRGKPQLADEPLRAAIRQNPQMKPPDGLVFPPQVIDHFLHVREGLFEEIRRSEEQRVKQAQEQAAKQEDKTRRERRRVAALEKLAQTETYVTRNRRWIGFVPFGVGQFQNGNDTLGDVFLTSEALLAAGTLTAIGVETHLVLQANQLRESGKKVDPSINGRLANWKTAIDYTSYTWLGVTVLGILEAQLSFVPERRETRTRPLPRGLAPPEQDPSLRLAPSAAAVPGGAVFGLSGTF